MYHYLRRAQANQLPLALSRSRASRVPLSAPAPAPAAAMPAPPSPSAPPAYGACLAAACDVLSVMPGQCAPVDALGMALDGPFAEVLAELGDVSQLATEFPDHVSYDLIYDALALIEHPRTLPPPDDGAVDARRLALRLLSAYRDNEPGVVPAATVNAIFAHHAKHIGQVGGPEAVADAYPAYLEYNINGSVELLDEPPNPLDPLSPADLARAVDATRSSAPSATTTKSSAQPSAATTTRAASPAVPLAAPATTAKTDASSTTSSRVASPVPPRVPTTTTSVTRSPTPSRDDAPNYVECLRTTCEFLKKRPAGTATLSDLNGIAGRFPRVVHELMSLKGLSIEFPDHITHNARLKALRVTSTNFDSLPPDGYIHRRRRALRLLLAYNDNQLGKLPPAVVQTILDKHRAELSGISTANEIARAYPMFTRIEPNGDLNLFSFPTRMLEPKSLEEEDEPVKPGMPAAMAKSAVASTARSTAAPTPASRPSTTGASTATRTTSAASLPPTTPPSTRATSAASQLPTSSSSTITTTATAPSPVPRSKSAVPAHWHPRRSLSRCDIFVVKSASTAWHLPAIVRDANVTKLGVSIELGADGTTADVISISFIDPYRVKPLVFVWDFARAPVADQPLMKMRLQSIMREPALVVVMHGRAAVRDLVRCLDVRPNMVDTQALFQEWMELTVAVWTKFGDAVAKELGAPSMVNVTGHATLNMVLDACKRPQNEHAGMVSVTDFRRGETFWDRHDAQGMLLEYTACNADQLVPAAYLMIKRVGELKALQEDADAREESEEEAEEVETGYVKAMGSVVEPAPAPAPAATAKAPAPPAAAREPVATAAKSPTPAGPSTASPKEAVPTAPASRGPSAVKEDTKTTTSRGVVGAEERKPASRAPTPAEELMPPPGLGLIARKEDAKPTSRAATGAKQQEETQPVIRSATVPKEESKPVVVPAPSPAPAVATVAPSAPAATTVAKAAEPEPPMRNAADARPVPLTKGHPSTHPVNGNGTHDDDDIDPSLGATWATAPLPMGRHAMARFAADTGALEWRNATGAEADDVSQSGAMSHDDFEAIEIGWRNDMEARLLFGILPPPIRAALLRHGANTINVLDELVLDIGRVPQVLFWDAGRVRVERLKQCDPVSRQDLDMICAPLQFGAGNRVGLEGTLHQFSRLLNRTGQVVGLTVRLGRESLPGRGVTGMLLDLMEGGNQSILIAGRSGRDRTTTVRDLASRLAARNHHVLVIDTYGELGGDSDVPHAALGQARRVHVPDRMQQHELIAEAVFNHAPDVLVLHDLITPDDFAALRVAAPRVHAVIVTAPGPLAAVTQSAVWRPLLVGGERVFDAAVEVVEQGVVRVARDVAELEGNAAMVQRRSWPWVGREQQPVQTGPGGERNGKVELGQGMFWVEWERI
ncbi:hypothetical protein AMAG_07561 [Allomyces macrogynus ATCC 38327]|uniref:Uncharacterized protein n=1 Tax=Allomyces macrogynus (strain ATCC 38327) TaxID=578462 RepID=A0A0L0SII8_ALLM3|nr:hypothetical protein AMAG_07561 [Allomyces macrogynus ATCC 38327]|eukprot:KNE62331.1 hypothetical protein AMAG_07561 [Allomyces macrogynus ATCC 38327]